MKKSTTAIISAIIGAAIGAAAGNKFNKKNSVGTSSGKEKFKKYYIVLNQWLNLKHEGKSLVPYFNDNGYKTIAIHGMGEMGNHLYEELKNSGITVKYGIDKNAGLIFSDLKIYTMEEELEEVDAIIVTAMFAYDEIEKELRRKTNCPVISLEDVVFEA